ncbi:MAG: hypothetical protein PHD19_12505 [Dechloromonas sp.]|nr:hypothetical protein [Dechloromonas sp.]
MKLSVLALVLSVLFGAAAAAEKNQKSNADLAADQPQMQLLLDEFSKIYTLVSLCDYRIGAVNRYYTEKYRNGIWRAAPGKVTREETDLSVGVAMVVAATFAEDAKKSGKKLTTAQCADIKKVVDEEIPRGYDN